MFEAALILQNQPDAAMVRHAAMALIAIMPLIILVILAIVIVPFWFICKKAGFSPWLSLLHIVPFGGLILVYVLAFSDWRVIPAPQAYWQVPPQPPLPPQG